MLWITISSGTLLFINHDPENEDQARSFLTTLKIILNNQSPTRWAFYAFIPFNVILSYNYRNVITGLTYFYNKSLADFIPDKF